MSIALTDAQKLDWLQLIRSDNVGPRTFRTLVNKFGGAGAALAALPDLLRTAKGERRIKLFGRDAAEKEYEATLRAGARFLALGEAGYPAALRAIDAPPPLLAARGALDALTRPACALVGSRNASAAGLAFAEKLARAFGREGLVVVSGLARGVDAAAHRASMATGTIGVLAGGLNQLYPAEHAALAEKMLEQGALVTEMPFDWTPRGRDFPRRNRLISGLALAVVVVEASRRSGSLITARFAAEQGREVFAAPGSPLDPRAEGTNDLLRDGASFCTAPGDVISVLRPMIEGVSRYERDLFEEVVPPDSDAPLWDETDWFGDASAPTAPPRHDADETRAVYSAAPDPRGVAPQQAWRSAPHAALSAPAAAPRAIIAQLLGPTPVGVDDLARAALLSAAVVRTALMELELEGLIARHGGDRVSLTPDLVQR